MVMIVSLYSILAARMAARFGENYSNFYFCEIESLENKRLDLVAKHGEEVARRIYTTAVGAVHVAANILGGLIGFFWAWPIRWLPFGEYSRYNKL
jgi:hypothetical protein